MVTAVGAMHAHPSLKFTDAAYESATSDFKEPPGP